MSSVMPSTFSAVDLHIVTSNDKPLTHAKEVCKALQYNKKAPYIIGVFCDQERFTQKHQMNRFLPVRNPADWPNDSQTMILTLMRERCMSFSCCFLVKSQKQKTLESIVLMWCFHILGNNWPTRWMKITSKPSLRSKEDISKPSQTVTTGYRPSSMKTWKVQVQIDVYQFHLQRCEDTINHLRARYVNHGRDLGKDNIIIILRKHATSVHNKYHDPSYYLSRIQRRKRYVKLRWVNQNFPDHEAIIEMEMVM